MTNKTNNGNIIIKEEAREILEVKMNQESKITVIDSLMGAGKTTWSIQYINENRLNNILYITPFLKEVERIIDGTKQEFKQPINKGNGKVESINDLLLCQTNIAATHELFKHLDSDSRANIKSGHYTLILDEVLNVIEPYDDIKDNDMQVLKDSGCITIDDEGYVIWNQDKLNYNTKYNEIKTLSENKSLIYINRKLLLWKYPPEIFNLFDKVYILTYLFDSSILKNYFDLHNIKYDLKSIKRQREQYVLVDYFVPDTTVFKDKINIYTGKLNNNFNQKITGLSKTWFSSKANNSNIKTICNNLRNYFGNILKAKSDTIMWTCYKDNKSKLKGKGYTSQFVSCNCRSTNELVDKYNLAYCINIYLHPAISQYFNQKGICMDEDLYALSEMIQWIWRSSIRNGGHINIYIPSIRMRNLLKGWLGMPLERLER